MFRVGKVASEDRLVESLMSVARRLEATAGVKSVEIRLARREVRVAYDESTSVPAMVGTVESVGFRASREASNTRVANAPAEADGTEGGAGARGGSRALSTAPLTDG